MGMKNKTKFKKKLEWLENTPWYIGKDGMPNMALIFGVFITGIIPLIIIILLYRSHRKKYLKKKLGLK